MIQALMTYIPRGSEMNDQGFLEESTLRVEAETVAELREIAILWERQEWTIGLPKIEILSYIGKCESLDWTYGLKSV